MKSIKKRYYSRKKNHQWPVDIIFMKKSEFNEKSFLGGVAMMSRREGRVLYDND